MLNLHSSKDRFNTTTSAVFAAVAEHFGHLAVKDIISPPRSWFDAYIARGVAMHVMVHIFNLPVRHLTKTTGRTRWIVNRSCRQIDDRLQCPVFQQHYQKIAARAEALLAEKFAEAA